MSVLEWIITASLAGGALSMLLAAAFALTARPNWVPILVSYAVGTMLGATFLEIIPHAVDLSNIQRVAAILLFGILLFFLLEKLVLWRHCHNQMCAEHGTPSIPRPEIRHAHGHDHGMHDHGRSGMMIMVGDTFHNFVDGILIAAAFLADIQLGILTAVAIIAHEIPQEVGDFLVLLHSGFSRGRAFLFNFISSLATLVGGLLGYFALSLVQDSVPFMLAIAASSMIYVAVADLIPHLHKRAELQATIQQVALIGLGVLTIWVVGLVIGH